MFRTLAIILAALVGLAATSALTAPRPVLESSQLRHLAAVGQGRQNWTRFEVQAQGTNCLEWFKPRGPLGTLTLFNPERWSICGQPIRNELVPAR